MVKVMEPYAKLLLLEIYGHKKGNRGLNTIQEESLFLCCTTMWVSIQISTVLHVGRHLNNFIIVAPNNILKKITKNKV